MSDSVLPHRQQPTRLPHPWDSPGNNTGVGCHFLLQCMKVRSESEVALSCLTLCDPNYPNCLWKVIRFSWGHEGWTGMTWLCLCVLSCFSCVHLFAMLWTIACQASLSMGFFRWEYWSGLPCPPPGDLPDPRIKLRDLLHLLHWQVDSLPLVWPGKPSRRWWVSFWVCWNKMVVGYWAPSIYQALI